MDSPATQVPAPDGGPGGPTGATPPPSSHRPNPEPHPHPTPPPHPTRPPIDPAVVAEKMISGYVNATGHAPSEELVQLIKAFALVAAKVHH